MDNFEDGMTFGELLGAIQKRMELENRCMMLDDPDYDLLPYDDDFWGCGFDENDFWPEPEDQEPVVGETFQSSPLMEGRPKRRRRNLGRIPRGDRYKDKRKAEGVRVVRERDPETGETVCLCRQECPPFTRRASICKIEDEEDHRNEIEENFRSERRVKTSYEGKFAFVINTRTGHVIRAYNI